MDYCHLGKTGLKVSTLCLGTMQFGWTADEALSFKILNAAFEAGINFIDTADVYSRWAEGNPGGVSESIIGAWMKSSRIPRHQLIIATKVRGRMGDGPNDQGLSRAHIFSAVEASLRRLETDYIDLYQSHSFDPNTPIEETLRAFDDLIHQGKVRYIGCSNYPAWRLTEALWTAEYNHLRRYDSLQPHYNLIHRAEFERELADVCRSYQIGVIPYSPLAAGFLTGKYRQGKSVESARLQRTSQYFSEHNWQVLNRLDQIVTQHEGASIAQIALAWLLQNPLVSSPIIGPRSLDQLQDNLGAVSIKLNEEQKQSLDQLTHWENA
jgi:aryl-alcohol dehydrogenase-like predicted oxidoreductase